MAKKKILVADNNLVHRQVHMHVLGRPDYVFRDCSVEEAAAAALKTEPDGIIMEVKLGLADLFGGVYALEDLRKDEKTSGIPIIIATTIPGTNVIGEGRYQGKSIGALCQELGAAAYFEKPYNHNNFRTIVRELFG